MTRDELLSGLDYDHITGNYRATETAASDYSEAWQDDAGQWWVSGDDVAEALQEVAKQKATDEWDQTWGKGVESDGETYTVKTDNTYWNVENHEGKVQEVDGTYQIEADYYNHFKAESITEFSEKY